MKPENTWTSKTLENLEKDIWSDTEHSSHLVMTCHKLIKKQLKNFNIEDLRIMIGQSIGLKFLIPLAIDKLTENILAEGNLFEGDLLKSVLTSETDYWKRETENWSSICNLFQANKDKFDSNNKDITEAYTVFMKINNSI